MLEFNFLMFFLFIIDIKVVWLLKFENVNSFLLWNVYVENWEFFSVNVKCIYKNMFDECFFLYFSLVLVFLNIFFLMIVNCVMYIVLGKEIGVKLVVYVFGNLVVDFWSVR